MVVSDEFDADDTEPGMSVVDIEEYDLRDSRERGSDSQDDEDELNSEYGEVFDTDIQYLPTGFYEKARRRQNMFFGISLAHIFVAFVGAYFLMGMSFTKSNIGTFGDEVVMAGTSGEVGIDASNAETQEIIDEEIVELEEAGDWGDNAKRIDSNERFKDLIQKRDKVGFNSWTEKKQWWAENKDHLDPDHMTAKEKRVANHFKKKEEHEKLKEERHKRNEDRKRQKEEKKRKKEERAKKHQEKEKGRDKQKGNEVDADATDLGTIWDKLAKRKHGGNKKGRGGGKKGKRASNIEQSNDQASGKSGQTSRGKAGKADGQ